MSDRGAAERPAVVLVSEHWRRPAWGFVNVYGHVEYRRVMMIGKRAARAQILAASVCEVDPQHGSADLVFDHCHDHDWVRAVVCPSCNVRLGQLDAVRKLAGITVVPGETGFGRVLMNCPGGIENMAAWIPSAGPFAPFSEPRSSMAAKPKSWENVLNLEFVVRPRAPGTVHARWGDRTACGLIADQAIMATTQDRYCSRCSATVPRRHWEAAIRDGHARGLITAGGAP